MQDRCGTSEQESFHQEELAPRSAIWRCYASSPEALPPNPQATALRSQCENQRGGTSDHPRFLMNSGVSGMREVRNKIRLAKDLISRAECSGYSPPNKQTVVTAW